MDDGISHPRKSDFAPHGGGVSRESTVLGMGDAGLLASRGKKHVVSSVEGGKKKRGFVYIMLAGVR